MSSFPTEPPLAWLWPASMLGRVVLLLGATLAATLLVAGLTLRAVSIDPSGEQMADLMASQIVAARALSRQGMTRSAASGEPLLDLAYAATPPAGAHAPWLPFLRKVVERLQRRLGPGTEVLVEEAAPTRLWVHTTGSDGGWIGIPIPHFAAQAIWLSLIVAITALLLVWIAGSLFARSLSRPLVRLARAAPHLAAGAVPDARLGTEGPREVRALATALIGAAHDVQAAARDRELMLAGLSHDLRTPLARLRLALEMLDGEQGLRNEMTTDLEELDAIVGQFIDYARDGREEGRQCIDLALIAQELAAQHWKGSDWHYDGPPQWWIEARPLALRRALANLLRNAVRHGRAPYELQLAHDDGGVLLAIRDRGDGAPAAQLASLGRPFFRAGNAQAGGSGLGLAVAARVAALHGGGLRLRNRDDGGFEAVLRLPPASQAAAAR